MKEEEYIKKWLDGSLTEEERKEFEKSDDYKSLMRLSESIEAFKSPEYNTEQELKRFWDENDHQDKVIKINWAQKYLSIAAVAAMLIVAYLYFTYNPATTVKTMASEKTNLYLPDSSFVMMNAFSQISYQDKNWNKQRKVTLDGEAFFKVAKGSRFDVETNFGQVTVLGTEFNVKSREGLFEVTCYEGSVKVQNPEKTLVLKPGQVFKIVAGELITDNIHSNDSPSWVSGKSHFESVPYKFILSEFERQYDVNVVSEGVNVNQLFTGGFVHDDMNLALKSITYPLNLSFKIEGKKVFISGDLD